MKKRLVTILLMAFLLMITGCGTSTNGKETTFAEFSVDYTTNDDGTYTCRGNNFKYKLEVSGIEGESQVAFIVLTNDTEISYEEVFYSMIKAEISTGVPEFVILGWYY